MTAGTGRRPRGAGRRQLHETALRLFARDGVEGTSLQAIAHEMGVSKAAVYYHFNTKDDLVLSVLEPLIAEISALSARVGAQRTRQARLDAMITGIVELALVSHDRFAVIMGDPYVSQLLNRQAPAQDWTGLSEVFLGTEGADRVALAVFTAGLLGPFREPAVVALGPDALRTHLTECGRRLLKIRRRPPPRSGY